MSSHSLRHSVLVLASALAALSAVPSLPAAAADALPAHDLLRPRIMQQAAGDLAAPAPAWASRPAPRTTTQAPAATAQQRPLREVFGFAQAGRLADPAVGYQTWDYSLLTTVAYFGLQVNAADGSLVQSGTGWTVWNSAAVTDMIGRAHAAGARVVLTVVYQDTGPGMCTALSHAQNTISQAVAQVRGRGVDGVNVDYEGVNAPCGGSSNRALLTQLVTGMRSALGAGANLTVDTYASSGNDAFGFFDIPGMAPQVDAFFVMAYELDGGSSGGNWQHPPLSCSSYCFSPTSPVAGYYWNDTRVVSEYSSSAGAGKVILGLPYYGYTACVTSPVHNAYPSSSPNWSVPTYAISSTETTDPSVQGYAAHRDFYDTTGQERWDTWWNASLGCSREMYWDDATSLGYKYDLVNRTGIRGAGIWSLDYGGGAPELWGALATHFTQKPGVPGGVTACAGAGSATVSWTPPAAGGVVYSYTVTASPGGAQVTVPSSATAAVVGGLSPGTSYTFTVTASNSFGSGPASTPSNGTTVAASVLSESWFPWYDNASPGMVADNVHVVSPAGASAGCVTVPGVAVMPFAVGAGGETHLSFHPGTIGGPVTVSVTAGPPVLASQRVQYYSSFHEEAAQRAADAATQLWLPWYDDASPGMVADNVHLVNPGSQPASGTIALGGSSLAFDLQPRAEGHFSFPAGTIGGPVRISSSAPVLASQRVQYYQSFNEAPALSASQASTTLYFNWYDLASPGMAGDNFHLVNPDPSATASGTISVAGGPSQPFTLGPGAQGHFSFPGFIGGPVVVRTSAGSPGVIAVQRVQYYRSFDEVPGAPAARAAATSWFSWYDLASPGMKGDNVHLLNPSPTAAAHGTISLPGGSVTFSVAPGGESHYSFPAGTIGGPVAVRVDAGSAPVIASQRVQYYESFNEAPAAFD
jgi:hypothetical protein